MIVNGDGHLQPMSHPGFNALVKENFIVKENPAFAGLFTKISFY
jgi:hypothetical protein